MHILLVDDDPADLELLKTTAENIAGKEYKISVARNKDEAIAAYAKHPIACALVDYYMRDLTGAELVNMLHALPRYTSQVGEPPAFDNQARLPIAVVTGSQSDEVKARVAETGALKYVTKDSLTSPETLDALFVELLNA